MFRDSIEEYLVIYSRFTKLAINIVITIYLVINLEVIRGD